jgi:hypothetical protein
MSPNPPALDPLRDARRLKPRVEEILAKRRY